MLPICFTHGLALLSRYFKSSTCVCSVIFSLQRRCMGVLCCYFRPKMFSPGDHVRYHSRTLGAHVLATVVGPSPNWLQFCHIWYIRPGGVTPVDHESAQLSRLEGVAVESPKSPESPDVTPMAPPHRPVQHTLCLSCKLSMCNSSKCVILVRRISLPFLWILNNICVG